MDPDATLKRIREIVAGEERNLGHDEISDLVESIRALDEWLSAGGFSPAAWRWES